MVLDYGTKKHKRVNRSTYAAELNAAIDTLDTAKLIQIVLEEVFNPGEADRLLSNVTEGRMLFPIEVCLDAKAVFDSIAAVEYSTPAEAPLVLHLHSIRDDLMKKRIARLWWIDTRDMVADGLNKGGLSRDPILAMCEEGHWTLKELPVACPK